MHCKQKLKKKPTAKETIVEQATVVVSPTNTTPNEVACEASEMSSVRTTVTCPNC